MPSFTRKIFSGILPLLLSKYLTSLIYIIFIREIATKLGPYDQGVFGQVTIILTIVITFINFGLDQYLIREESKNPSENKKLISNIIILKIIFSVLSTFILLYILGIFPLTEIVKEFTLLAIPFVFFSILADTFESLLQAHQRFLLFAVTSILQKVILTVGGIIFIGMKYGTEEIIYLFIFSSFFRFFLTFIYTFKYYRKTPITFNFLLITNSIKVSFPLFISILLGSIYYQVDNLMLGIFKSEISVGYYYSAVQIVMFILCTPMIFMNVIFPILTRLHKEDFHKFIEVYRKSIKLLTNLAILILIILEGIAIYLFPFIYSDQYIVSGYLFKILLLALPFHFCNSLFANTIFIIDKQKYLPFFSFLVTILNIGLNWILIPRFDFYGAAWVTVTSEIVSACVGLYLIKKYMKERYPIKEMFLPLGILVLSIILGMFTAKLISNHETVIYFFVLIYFTLISFFTGSISISEIKKTASEISGLK